MPASPARHPWQFHWFSAARISVGNLGPSNSPPRLCLLASRLWIPFGHPASPEQPGAELPQGKTVIWRPDPTSYPAGRYQQQPSGPSHRTRPTRGTLANNLRAVIVSTRASASQSSMAIVSFTHILQRGDLLERKVCGLPMSPAPGS